MSESIAASGTQIAIGTAGLTAVLGYLVVFIGLILLMAVVWLVGRFLTKKTTAAPQSVSPAPSSPAPAAPSPFKAPGSAGGVKLYNVEERDAAMIMAIVADKTGKPLNELRFKSIREVTEDEV